jgi:small subunit ribosomal protein S7
MKIMSRRKKNIKRINYPDPIYNSEIAQMIINKLLLKGKKTLAQNIFYETMDKIKSENKQEPMEVLNKAINNIKPNIELKTKRVGGSTYQVPIEINRTRSICIAIRFLIKSARKRPGKNMRIKLKNEIIDASNNTGNSIKKKEEIHKMAEANKVYTTIKL